MSLLPENGAGAQQQSAQVGSPAAFDAQLIADIQRTNALYEQLMYQHQFQQQEARTRAQQQPVLMMPMAPMPLAPSLASERTAKARAANEAPMHLDSTFEFLPVSGAPAQDAAQYNNPRATIDLTMMLGAPVVPPPDLQQQQQQQQQQRPAQQTSGWQPSSKPTAQRKVFTGVMSSAQPGADATPVMPLTPAAVQQQQKLCEVQKSFLERRNTLRNIHDPNSISKGLPVAPSPPAAAPSPKSVASTAAPAAAATVKTPANALRVSLGVLTFGSLELKVTPGIEQAEDFEVQNTSQTDAMAVDVRVQAVPSAVLKVEPSRFSLGPLQKQAMRSTFLTNCTTAVVTEALFTCVRMNSATGLLVAKEVVRLPVKVESALSSSLDFTEFAFVGDVQCVGALEPRVLKATWRGQDCSVTMIERAPETASLIRRYEHETDALEKLRSPYLLHCFGAIRVQSLFCMVTETEPGQTLLAEVKAQAFSPLLMVRCALDIARAMCYVHAAGYTHKNLTPASVLLVSRDIHAPVCCKVARFGCCRESGHVDEGDFGNQVYMPPEVLEHRPGCKSAVDVYSYGGTLWYMTAREEPFDGTNFEKAYLSLVLKGKRLEIPPSCPPDLAAAIQLCWEQNPADRPEFAQLVFILEPLFMQLKIVEDASQASGSKRSFPWGKKKS